MKSDILTNSFLFRSRWKQKPDRRTIAIEIISILLMLLFGLTAIDKARQFERFYEELGKSPFLMAYQGEVAWGTPIVEGIVTVSLAFGKTQLWGLSASVFLMSVFTAYIFVLLNYSYYTSCLCSAALENLTWEEHLVFNIVFLVLSTIALNLKKQHQTTRKKQ